MKLLLFITSLTLISFGCINTSVARTNDSSIDVPTTGINTSRDVLGWDKVHLNMKRKDLVKALGSKLEPLSKDLSAHYVIKNVQFGPITTDLRIIMFHTGDDDNRDPVAGLSADYQGPINNVLVENITKHFIRTYGDGEVLVDGHSVQGNYKKRIRWRFPTTTIQLILTHRVDLGKNLVSIEYYETISKKHSVVVSKEMLNELKSGDRLIVIAWNKTPVFIFHRTKKEIEFVISRASEKHLADPDSLAEPWRMQLIMAEQYPLDFSSEAARSPLRSKKDEYGVFIASSPLSGCIPVFFSEEARTNYYYMKDKEEAAITKWEKGWMSGFYDPCKEDYFDIAGRMYKGTNYGTNLSIPMHRYDEKGNLIIGY